MEDPGVKVTVSFPVELFMALEKASQEEERPLANMVRYLVKRGIADAYWPSPGAVQRRIAEMSIKRGKASS